MHIEVVNLDEFKDAMPFFVPELGFTLQSAGDVTRTRGRFAFQQNVPAIAGTNASDMAELLGRLARQPRRQLARARRSTSAARSTCSRSSTAPASSGRGRCARARWRTSSPGASAASTSLGTRVIPQAEGVLGGLIDRARLPAVDRLGRLVREREPRVPLPHPARAARGDSLAGAVARRLPARRPTAATACPTGTWCWSRSATGARSGTPTAVPGETDDASFGSGLGFEIVVRRNFAVRLDYGWALLDVPVRPGERRRHRAPLLRDDAVLSDERKPDATPSSSLRHLMVSVLTALIAVGPARLAFAGPHQTGGNGKGTVDPGRRHAVGRERAERRDHQVLDVRHRARRDRAIRAPSDGGLDPRAQPHRQQRPDEDRRCDHAAGRQDVHDLHREPGRRVLRRRREDQRRGPAGRRGQSLRPATSSAASTTSRT